MELLSKSDAKTRGEKYFFTGIACNHDHIVNRFVSDGTCTECRRLKSKEWYADKAYGAEKQRRWRSDPENKKKERAAVKARWAENPEKHREYHRDYNAANRDATRKKCRNWYHRNKSEEVARCLIKQRTRKAQKNAGGVHTAADIADIFKMQRGKCAICRTKVGNKYHVDHIIPLKTGGSNDRRNLQVTCPPCNNSKSARDPITFMQMRGMLL